MALALCVGALTACTAGELKEPGPPPGVATEAPAIGPWGELLLEDINVEPPPSAVRPTMCSTVPPVWVIPGGTPARLEGLFEAAQLPDARRAELRSGVRCTATSCEMRPSLGLIQGLAPAERQALYDQLRLYPENPMIQSPLRYGAGRLTSRLAALGLPRTTTAMARQLLWRSPDGSEALSDFEVLCGTLATDKERLLLMRGLIRAAGVIATLRVPHGADVAALARYWGSGPQRDNDLGVLLGSLAARPVGGQIDVVHLIPRFARGRVNTFPDEHDPPWSCHYTALNFFAAQPDESLLDMQQVDRALHERYRRLPPSEPLRLGDLVLLARKDGTLVHSAVHLAGNLLFTKNGRSATKPWVLMRRADVEAIFDAPVAHLFRRTDVTPQ